VIQRNIDLGHLNDLCDWGPAKDWNNSYALTGSKKQENSKTLNTYN